MCSRLLVKSSNKGFADPAQGANVARSGVALYAGSLRKNMAQEIVWIDDSAEAEQFARSFTPKLRFERRGEDSDRQGERGRFFRPGLSAKKSCIMQKRSFLLLVLAAVPLLIAACSTARVRVAPEAPLLAGRPTTRPLDIALYIDPQVTTFQHVARTFPFAAGSGYGAVEVTFDLGSALSTTVETAVRRHFREVQRAAACSPEADGLVSVGFAKHPAIDIRWTQRMASEGGGATVELALALTARRCDGPVLWQGVAAHEGRSSECSEFEVRRPD